jgi:hypothetical protein
MPAAIPGLVMGLGYILAFNKPYFFFYGTPWIIVINIVICNFTLGILSSISNLRNIDPSIEEASISLGGDTFRTFFRIIFPLSRVAFFQNFVYFFMRSMTTISAVIFLVLDCKCQCHVHLYYCNCADYAGDFTGRRQENRQTAGGAGFGGVKNWVPRPNWNGGMIGRSEALAL